MKKILGLFLIVLSMRANADTEIQVAGDYIIPPTASLAVSSLPLRSVLLTKDSTNQLHLKLQMPEDLTGPDSKVLIFEPSSSTTAVVQFSGELLSLVCLNSDDSLSCLVKYPSDYSNELAKEDPTDFLNAKYASDPSLAAKKVEVAAQHRRDPEGFIVLRYLSH